MESLPKNNQIFYDIGMSGRNILSLCIGTTTLKDPVIKYLIKKFGPSFVSYYEITDTGRLVALEWFIKHGAKEFQKLTKSKIWGKLTSNYAKFDTFSPQQRVNFK